MTQAEVHQNRALAGEKTGVYLGTETALSFAGARQELEILRCGCAIFDLSWRALVTVAGKDRMRWLHNMVSNNVRDLQPNRGNYNFVLNAQGRILGDMYVFNRGESILLETDRNQVETLLTTLRRFIIMDKVELNDTGSQFTAIGVAGPKAPEVLGALGTNAKDQQPLESRDCSIGDVAVPILRGPEQKGQWFEIWTEPSQAEATAKLLIGGGAQRVGVEALEMWRILRGIPQYGKDIRDRDLPQETGQMQALSFNKGCYIGQEIVERIRSRGQVHRRFTGFEFQGSSPVPGKFEAEGRAVAEITSTTRVPGARGDRDIGLGYVRQEAVPASGVLDLNGIPAKVVNLPFE